MRRLTTEVGRLACRLGIAALIVLPGCGDSSPTSPSGPALTEVTTSTHYVVAVAHSTDPVRGVLRPRWNSTDIDVLARSFDATGRLPPVGSLLGNTDFFRFDTNITYPCAGSFVRYLIDRYGLSPLKAYFASATFEDAAAVTEARFQAAYGRTIAALWDEWRAQIR